MKNYIQKTHLIKCSFTNFIGCKQGLHSNQYPKVLSFVANYTLFSTLYQSRPFSTSLPFCLDRQKGQSKEVTNNNHSLSSDFRIDSNVLNEHNFGYLVDLANKNNKLRWASGKSIPHRLGSVGNMDNYDYTSISLDNLSDFNNNVTRLTELFNLFNSYNSYALAFLIVNGRDQSIKTLGRHFLVNNTTDVKSLLSVVYEIIDELSSKYNFLTSDNIIVKYRPLHFKVNNPSFTGGKVRNTPMLPSNTNLGINYKLLSSNYLPHTMNLQFYGTLLLKQGNILWFDYNNVIIKVVIVEENNFHILEIYSKNKEKVIARVEDLAYDNTFIRGFNISSSPIVVQYDNNFNLINLEFDCKVKYINKDNKIISQDSNILTFDIETYLDCNNSTPYACGFYDGKNTYTYYRTDYSSSEEMLVTCINEMLKPKYHNYTVYCHNFGKFDCIFLHKIFHKYYNVSNIISKEMNIITLTIKSKTKYGKIFPKLKFSDSICIIPSSLDSLAKSFDVATKKDIFPYTFVHKDNLEYSGDIPDFKYYKNISLDEYNNIKNSIKKWCLKDETLSYLTRDVICLHQIILKMSDIIFKRYRVNITKYNTISGLSMGIYRSNYLKPEFKIPNTSGDVEKAIRSAYFGGRTEVFTPLAENIVSYDFNSLFPTAMLKPMPAGQPIYSLCKDLSQIFGFVKAKITTTDDNIPVLPARVNINGTEKLVFANGKWTGWYFSEELKLGKSYGYKIEILESYIFEKSYNYFDGYVRDMANIKDNSTGAMRVIHKMLLNTLYGRLGMKDTPEEIKIVSRSEGEQIHLTHNVIDNFAVSKDKEYIRFSKTADESLCVQSGIDYYEYMTNFDSKPSINTSSAIAAAITSWSRIIMYPYIRHSVYTDTDSTYRLMPLNGNIIGNKLGQFKPEYGLIKTGVFPSNKLYILILENGKIVSKTKGFSGGLTLSDYNELYNSNTINVTDVRWKRNLDLSTVNISHHNMQIAASFDKRRKLFSLGKWVGTTPLYINEDMECVTTALTLSNNKNDYITNYNYNLNKSLVPYNFNKYLISYNDLNKSLILYTNNPLKIMIIIAKVNKLVTINVEYK